MRKREVNEQSLLGQFYPCTHRYFKPYLEEWRDVLLGPNKNNDIEEWYNLEFDFTGKNKDTVYRDLARAFAYGWFISNNLSALARYIASHSNLTTNRNLKTRSETIRQGIKRQLKLFEKEIQTRKQNGSFIIIPQQGYLPANSDAGAGCRVNQNRQ